MTFPLLLAAAAVILVPGAAWLAWFPLRQRDGFEQAAVAAGLSISLSTLGGLGLFLLGGALDRVTLWLAVGLMGVLLAAGLACGWAQGKTHWMGLAGIALAAGFAAIALWWRLTQAEGLIFPAWVDSLHHTLIVRKMLDIGTIPATLQPYLDVPFYYHFGFHWLAAAFAWLGGLKAEQAVLLFGQVVNALVGVSVYRLAKAIWGDPLRAITAALVVTFGTHMPAYYLTWGRYTLLLGLVLLPLAMAEVVEIGRFTAQTPVQERRRSAVRLGLLGAGLALAHYMALVLLIAWVGICVAGKLVESVRGRRWERQAWLGWIGGGGLGLLLALPWLVRVAQYSNVVPSVSVVLSAEAATQRYSAEYAGYLWYLLGPQRNYILLYLAGAGLLAAILNKKGWGIALWSALLGLQALPWGWHVRPFRPDHFAILMFLPIGLLVGNLLWLLAEGWSRMVEKLPKVGAKMGWSGYVLAGVLCVGICGWGLKETRSITNPATILADAADRQAMDWIVLHTPEDARFFINTAFWQGNNYRPTDGGAWILPATGRWELVPTIFFGFGEQAQSEEINARAKAASAVGECDAVFWELVSEAHITHLYLREGVGSLQAAALQDCEGVSVLYQAGGVSIWAVEEGANTGE